MRTLRAFAFDVLQHPHSENTKMSARLCSVLSQSISTALTAPFVAQISKPEENSALVARLGTEHHIIINSGTTSHIHPFAEDFTSINAHATSIEELNGSLGMTGRRTLSLLTKANSIAPKLLHFRDALCTPGAQISLISVSRLDSAGHRVSFDSVRCVITDRKTNQTIATATLRDRLYHLDLSSAPDIANVAHPTSDLHLWHQRLGHLNFSSLRLLVRGKLVDGITVVDVNAESSCTCEHCITGRMHRLPFPKEAS